MKKKINQWSAQDSARALKEGWEIFNTESYPEIQRDDEQAKFNNDYEARVFVMEMEGKGSKFHRHALACLGRAVLDYSRRSNSPRESGYRRTAQILVDDLGTILRESESAQHLDTDHAISLIRRSRRLLRLIWGFKE